MTRRARASERHDNEVAPVEKARVHFVQRPIEDEIAAVAPGSGLDRGLALGVQAVDLEPGKVWEKYGCSTVVGLEHDESFLMSHFYFFSNCADECRFGLLLARIVAQPTCLSHFESPHTSTLAPSRNNDGSDSDH